MTYVFIDTNIFIHFRDFEEIDWPSVTGKQGAITLLIAPIVIDELDKHKYNFNKKIANRVKKLLPRIEAILENKSSCRYVVHYIPSRPMDETFSDNKLNRKEQDDSLLATIIEFQNSVTTNNGDAVVYVTNDVGPRLKARTLGIETIKLADDYQLPTELDDTEKENKALQKELADLKNKVPVIKLLFHSNLNLLTVKPISDILGKREVVDREMAKIKAEYLPLVYYPATNEKSDNTLFNLMNNSFIALSEEQVEKYNKELLQFYASYETYFASVYNNYSFRHNSLEIQLVLQNTGTTPAIDIDVNLHFPDGFEIVEQSGLLKIQPKPKPPYKPKNRLDIPSIIMPITFPSLHRTSDITESMYDPNRPVIKKTNSYDVDYSFRSLKHHQIIELDILYLKYQDITTDGKGFSLDYKIIVGNLPKPVNGQLHVRFEKSGK